MRPDAAIRALVLFAGNAFLGNFRVPSDSFAVQWDLEAQTEGSVGKPGRSLLIELDGQSRLYQSWVTLFPDSTSMIQALHQAWKSYRSPLDAEEVLEMREGQVLRWRWNGRLRLDMGIEWSLAAGWSIPGKIPWMNLQKHLFSGASLGARFQVREAGEFSLQLRRRATRTELRVRRTRERGQESSFVAGVGLGSELRVSRLGPPAEGVLGTVARGLSQPLRKKMNRGLNRALTRNLEIALALEKRRWKRQAALLEASWSEDPGAVFLRDYSRLLRGVLPPPHSGAKFSGSFERIRGRRVTLHLSLLNWAGLERSREHEERQTFRISPTGDLVLENAREFRKTRHDWDEAQFLRLLDQETIEKGRRRRNFLWSYGREEEFSYAELQQFLKMALKMGVLNAFDLPARAHFPLTAQLVVVTRFSPGGLARVREASGRRKWEALVGSLEIVDPERYAEQTFWRDWIDSPKLRSRIDRDPVQAYLATQYPVAGRSTFQRQQVVAVYRRAKRFFRILEHWKAAEHGEITKAFSGGLDLPIFVFFHLLCPTELRDSGVLMTGDIEQVWGNEELLESAGS